MQAVAAELAGYPENSAAFWRGEFKLQEFRSQELQEFRR
jgi:hypothetical protein